MAFLPDGNIHFAATLAKNKQNKIQNIQGTDSQDFALRTIQPFIDHPTRREAAPVNEKHHVSR